MRAFGGGVAVLLAGLLALSLVEESDGFSAGGLRLELSSLLASLAPKPLCFRAQSSALSAAFAKGRGGIHGLRMKEGGQEEEPFTGGGELTTRIQKIKLEDQWLQTRIKAKPAFLDFETASSWARFRRYWDSKEEWEDWVANGEKRNQYIPSNPEKYYGERGEWLGWEYWLGLSDEPDR